MENYHISPAELEAIALAAGKEKTRHYLCGVLLEAYADGIFSLIACDGHRLATLRAGIDKAPISSFIIPAEDIKKALMMVKAEKKRISKYDYSKLMISINKNGDILSIVIASKNENEQFIISSSFTTKIVNGSFPDWRRILPLENSDCDADVSFSGRYMNDFIHMAELLTLVKGAQIAIKNNGRSNPITLTFPKNAEFFGVLMPMRQ